MSQSVTRNFNAYGKYYDLLYKDKDYEMESEYVIELINRYHPETSTILELGSGSGAHARYLCQQGYRVTGLERSQEMVEEARRKKLPGFTPLQADITDFSLDNSFHTAISLFHVVSYLTETPALIQTFESTARHLATNGIFIFDVWYTPAVLTLRPETRIKRMSDADVQIIRIAESSMDINRNIVDVSYEVHVKEMSTGRIETIQETHPMRHFSVPEIDLLARHTGFELLRAEEFNTSLVPTAYTWGVCFILRKRSTL